MKINTKLVVRVILQMLTNEMLLAKNMERPKKEYSLYIVRAKINEVVNYSIPYFKALWRRIYEANRFPLTPIIGSFPVKLITFIGDPIEYDPNRTVEELRDLTRQRIEELIRKHQKKPQSVLQAFLDRFRTFTSIKND